MPAIEPGTSGVQAYDATKLRQVALKVNTETRNTHWSHIQKDVSHIQHTEL